ncbi:MAG: hypothetical protein CL929_01260 [Deltaproteobacteria bacterium]|nr:hypothetical protein [Deltaproteobacteria bacterium]
MMRWMMSCEEARELISAGLDQELPWTRRLLVRFHLSMCKKCSAVAQHLRALREYRTRNCPRNTFRRRHSSASKPPCGTEVRKPRKTVLLNPIPQTQPCFANFSLPSHWSDFQ